ncbi:hypothetical protein NPS70_01040 [Streptomyces sp. C10-9-1]|uniref:hypothetical protein n=1 Tax=Streptomyces sp. C10-9-1 TaxID=1859285 RepID=UPI00211293D8|nr:hypothetical protein [Streptomyces sp. C10-9-1]MCQ6551791.1 hypothetical protein [Streptomyces sp. C10-9-1]
MPDPHPLLRYLHDAADGRFPAVDGRVTVLPVLPGGLSCSVAFTGHSVIATDLPGDEVLARGPDGYGGAQAPDFLRYLAGPDGWIDCLDAVLAARGAGGGHRLPRRTDAEDHPRVRRARALRGGVRVHGDGRGLVTLARGPAGRRELSIELDGGGHGGGHGRSLLRDALTLVPEGEPVFAAVSPGNARSLRAFLAAGFVPLGSEVVLRRGPSV